MFLSGLGFLQAQVLSKCFLQVPVSFGFTFPSGSVEFQVKDSLSIRFRIYFYSGSGFL
jgi:hypothetical protein